MYEKVSMSVSVCEKVTESISHAKNEEVSKLVSGCKRRTINQLVRMSE